MKVFIRSPIWVTPAFASQYAGPDGSNFECKLRFCSTQTCSILKYILASVDTDKQMAGFEGSPQEYKEYQRKLDRALSELTVAVRFLRAVDHVERSLMRCQCRQFYTDAPEQATLSKLAEEDMKARLKGNTALAEKLIPTFPFGCRRPTPGNGFLEAYVILHPNGLLNNANRRMVLYSFSNSSTEAVISPVEQITSKGIRTADGQESEFDV